MNPKSTIIINNTRYIPARDAEVGFLVAILGIVTGIVFGFFVLKMNFSTPQTIDISQPEAQSILYEEVSVQEPKIPLYNLKNQSTNEESQGLKDISV